MIKLLADENVEARVSHLLRSEGYSVVSIQETQSGVADEIVMETAVSSATILLTGDSDFGNYIFNKATFTAVFCFTGYHEPLPKRRDNSS